MSTSPLPGYDVRPFEGPLRGGFNATHDVYERGEGPPVILIQELPGIGPETLRLADRLVEAGFRVVMPHLFGPLGRVAIASNTVRVMCMRREFDMFSRRRSSPIVDWLSALCRDVSTRNEGADVGVIGMCLTGNFALSLIAEPAVVAAVASQPAMPALSRRGLQLAPDEIRASRAALDRCGPMLALRFERDPLCPAGRFEAIETAFNGDGQRRVETETLPGRGHSVLTLDFVDEAGHPTREALVRVLRYFGERLRATEETS